MSMMLTFFKEKYCKMNCLTVAKSLAYFDDAELEPDPVTLLGISWEDVKLRFVQIVPTI